MVCGDRAAPARRHLHPASRAATTVAKQGEQAPFSDPMSIVETILPLFALVLLGFVAIRSGYVSSDHIAPVGDFVVKIALPALIFDALTGAPLGDAINWSFVLGYGGASLLVFAFGLAAALAALRMPLSQAGMIGLGMSGSNSGFMGYPIALSVIGAPAAPILAQCMLVENLLIIPFAVALAETAGTGGDRGPARALARAAGQVARNPIVVALCAALVVAAVGIPIPSPASKAIDMLAGIAAPVALFVVGGTVASLPLAGMYRHVGLVVAGKLLVHPLAVLAALANMPGIDPTTLTGGMIFASAPMLSVFPLLGQRAGLRMLTATALLVATVASFVTITLVLTLLGGPLGI